MRRGEVALSPVLAGKHAPLAVRCLGDVSCVASQRERDKRASRRKALLRLRVSRGCAVERPPAHSPALARYSNRTAAAWVGSVNLASINAKR